MVSKIQRLLYIHELPRHLYDLEKQGFNHFEFDYVGKDRIWLQAWRKQKPKPKVKCEDCSKELGNKPALEMHQQMMKHGRYASLILTEL